MMGRIYNKLYFYWSKYKKQGFTLAEALIITVMTGYCLLPILGTMENAQTRTQNYDHQSKMQLYSRSRLNSIIANAAFDHTTIKTEDEYHYIVYLAFCKNERDDGKEEDAKLVELPKTSVTLDKMIHFMDNTFNIGTENISNHPDVYRLLGLEYNPRSPKPYLKLVHAYKTSVELKEQPMLEHLQSNGEPQSLDSPKALLGIVVKTCLLQSNDEIYDTIDGHLEGDESIRVPPVTLFSFVNLPTVSDEMIWLADAYNCLIYGIDPVSKTIASTISLPMTNSSDPANEANDINRPWHIAVHPSIKMLAVLRKNSILLVNINRKSTDFGNYKDFLTSYTFSENICSEGNKSYNDGALAFRPDGKFLYCYSSKDKRLYRFGGQLNFETWSNTLTDPPKFNSTGHLYADFNSTNISGLVPANDGYLYISFTDVNNIFRVPMYPQDETNLNYDIFASCTSSINSIDVSPDGLKLAAVTMENNSSLRIYDTRDRKLLKNETIYVGSGRNKYENPFKVAFAAVSSSTRSITDTDSLNLTITNISSHTGNNGEGNELILAKVFNATNSTTIRNLDVAPATNQETITGSLIVVSPDNQSVVIADKNNPQVYIGKTGVESESEVISDSKQTLLKYKNTSETKNCSDLATNKRDVLAVACGNNVKIYDLNTKKEIEDSEFTATDTITSISMSPQGDFLLTCHETATGSYFFNLTDNTTQKPQNINSTRKKIVFDDNHPYMAFALQNPIDRGRGDKKFYNISHTSLDRWEKVATDSYDRRAFTIEDTNWESLDMIGMPNGGAMVLYGKDDGSTMLEWIGRRNWNHDPKKDKYKLFARWTNMKKSTPPNFPSNAITDPEYLDSAKGTIVVVYTPLQKNTTINCITYLHTYDNDGGFGSYWYGGYKYITPILLKKIDTKFDIVSKAKPIELENNKSYVNIKIEWDNGYCVDEENTYYLGWWNGKNSKPNTGVVGYKDGDGDFKSDVKDLSNNDKFQTIPSSLKYNNGNSRKYAIQFGYIQEEEYFPPLNSQKLAISPDCGTLAILSKKNDNDSKLNFYDFNNQIYGPETQLEGMLVDYRETFQSGSWPGGTNPTFGWPNETARHFRKVADFSHFNSGNALIGSIDSLASATTKHDSWTSFNNYPANYYFDSYPAGSPNQNSVKSTANKRFFGYLRPEYNATKFLARIGDDVRFFINNNYVYGRYETGSPVGIPNTTINCKAFESSIIQIDQASNGDGMYLSAFLGSDTANFTSFATTQRNGESVIANYYSPTSGATDWNNINSSETYILKNIPPHIYTKNLDGINPTNSDILFSRDRSRPILYILDKINNKLWNSKTPENSFSWDPRQKTNSNPVITTDGQKLLLVIDNKLSAIDITSDSSMSSSDLITLSNESGDSTKPRYIANKPLCSNTSTDASGTYNLITVSAPYNTYTPAMNGAMTVANGGIYIYNNGKKGFLCYNPQEKDFNKFENVLSKNAPYCPITSYDNKIYVFGNDGTDSDDPISNRVQCYDIVNNSSMTTLLNYGDGFTDEYQVSLGVQDQSPVYPNNQTNNFKKVEISDYFNGQNVTNAFHAFIKNKNHYVYTNNSNPYVEIKFDTPLTVNKIKLSNYYESDYKCGGVQVYGLKGSNDTSYNNILNNFGSTGRQEKNDYTDMYENTFNDVCYKYYRLNLVKLLSFHNGGSGLNYFEKLWDCGNVLNDVTFLGNIFPTRCGTVGSVNLIQLWRTGVKKLTPDMRQFSETELTTALNDSGISGKKGIKWTNSLGQDTIMQWSSNDEDNKNFGKIYVTPGNITDTNNYFTDTSKHYKSDEHEAWVKITLPEPEALCAIRYANKEHDCSEEHNHMLQTMYCYGSNENNCPSNETTPPWVALNFTHGDIKFVGPKIFNTYITAEIKNPKKYKHYLIKMDTNDKTLKLNGFQLYASCEQPTKDFLTPLLTDDLGEVKVGAGACCTTPYGFVIAGGHVDNVSNSYATTTALLYWPHAINKYDGKYKQFGISRSLPPLHHKRCNHSLVWHKGKIYAIGGCPSNGNNYAAYSKVEFAECFDYNKMKEKWDECNASYTLLINGATDDLFSRYYQGACSFGNEIFVFGGRKTSNDSDVLNDAFAWNPETGIVRKLKDLPEGIKPPICAVACGSKIYIAGNDGASSPKLVMCEYTP